MSLNEKNVFQKLVLFFIVISVIAGLWITEPKNWVFVIMINISIAGVFIVAGEYLHLKETIRKINDKTGTH